MELLNSGSLPSVVCDEESRAGLVVLKPYCAEFRFEAFELDMHKAILLGQGCVSIVPDVKLSVRVRFAIVNEVTLLLVSLAWRVRWLL